VTTACLNLVGKHPIQSDVLKSSEPVALLDQPCRGRVELTAFVRCLADQLCHILAWNRFPITQLLLRCCWNMMDWCWGCWLARTVHLFSEKHRELISRVSIWAAPHSTVSVSISADTEWEILFSCFCRCARRRCKQLVHSKSSMHLRWVAH